MCGCLYADGETLTRLGSTMWLRVRQNFPASCDRSNGLYLVGPRQFGPTDMLRNLAPTSKWILQLRGGQYAQLVRAITAAAVTSSAGSSARLCAAVTLTFTACYAQGPANLRVLFDAFARRHACTREAAQKSSNCPSIELLRSNSRFSVIGCRILSTPFSHNCNLIGLVFVNSHRSSVDDLNYT